ncbi:hypothetical protein HLRTI_000446 [Halorhabdus tiamatea SARL4B]|uniref:DUF3267 domain-containing protein n=1 Tax=Halorhabdus tiamatea SARL4B TaxID=1033806 RepID=F7PMK4_9EURY|nr:DUF3267 domain-containing protein [Halorhabdus tiamatea]ERJ07404.1 hypothetical protein HLRTI_000446 [Halorhabdus tiamatea SARL4B]
MNILDRYLIPLVLAPGVIIHELAHYLACKGTDVPVQEVAFFRFGSPPGYVKHAIPRSYTKRIVITMAPFLLNTGIAIALFAWSVDFPPFEGAALMLLGTIILSSAVPSGLDTANLFPHSVIGWFHPLFLLSLPLIVLLFALNKLRPYGSNHLITALGAGLLFLTFHTSVIDAPTLEMLREVYQP